MSICLFGENSFFFAAKMDTAAARFPPALSPTKVMSSGWMPSLSASRKIAFVAM